MELRIHGLERTRANFNSPYDFDTSLSSRHHVDKPTKRQIAEHYGFEEGKEECMVAHVRENNHVCLKVFMLAKKEDKDILKDGKRNLLYSLHTVPVGVVDKYDFYKMFDTCANPENKYTRKWDANSCDQALLVCGFVKDLFDIGAITILPSNPMNGRYPLEIFATGSIKEVDLPAEYTVEDIGKMADACSGMKLGWPYGNAVRPYIRNMVEHAKNYTKDSRFGDFEAILSLSETLTVSRANEEDTTSNNEVNHTQDQPKLRSTSTNKGKD